MAVTAQEIYEGTAVPGPSLPRLCSACSDVAVVAVVERGRPHGRVITLELWGCKARYCMPAMVMVGTHTEEDA